MITEFFSPIIRKFMAVNKSPVDDFWYTTPGREVSSGVTVNEEVALTYSAVWQATRLLAGTAAWLPLDLIMETMSDLGENRKIQRQRPEHKMLHMMPNPEMPAFSYRAQSFHHQINWGTAYSEIVRNELGRVVQLWPIHPSRVTPYRDDEGRILYEVRNNFTQPPTVLPFEKMLNVPSMMTEDGIVGRGVITAARESIGMGIATERYGAGWFGHGSIPRIVVSMEGDMTSDARDNFRREWKDIYGSPDGERVALLTDGGKITPLNISNEDSQFLETRVHNISEISRWYGVPPHMLADLRQSALRNIETQGIEFVVYTLIQWLVIWEQMLWMKVLPVDDQDDHMFKFNVNALMRGDSEARAKFYQSMINFGILSRNEVRELEDRNPVPGGDTFLVQGAMAPVDEDGNVGNMGLEDQGMIEARPEPDDEDDQLKNDLFNRVSQTADAIEKIDATTKEQLEISKVIHKRMKRKSVDVRLLDRYDEIFNKGAETTQKTSEAVETLAASINDLAQNTTAQKNACVQAANEMLRDSVQRLLAKQQKSAIRAAGKPKSFLTWIDEFYEIHENESVTAFKAPCYAMTVLGAETDPAVLAKDYCGFCREQILEKSGEANSEQLQGAITELVNSWSALQILPEILK